MSEEHYSGQIAEAAVTLLRAEEVAGKEVWRDRIEIAHDESDPLDLAVVVHLGAEEILERDVTSTVDVLLELKVECVARGNPVAMTGATNVPSTRLANLRRAVTRVLHGDTLSGTKNLGLAYVIDVSENGCSEVAPIEGSQWQMAGQMMSWTVHYRRSRVDPGSS